MHRSLIDRLRQAIIIDGTWDTGHELPPERQLVHVLGASRTKIREAIAVLISEGMLEIRRGKHTVVRNVMTSGSFELFGWVIGLRRHNAPQLLGQLLWLRRTIYVQLAPLLAASDPRHERIALGIAELRAGPLPLLLRSEELLLCFLADQAGNTAATVLLQSIRRMLESLVDFGDATLELPDAKDRFRALTAAIQRKDAPETARLLEELCRLREALYIQLATDPACSPSSSSSPRPPTLPSSTP